MLRISNLLPRKYHSFDFLPYSSLKTVIKISIKFLLFYKMFSIGLNEVSTKLIGPRKLGAEINNNNDVIDCRIDSHVSHLTLYFSQTNGYFRRHYVIFTDIATPLAFAQG